MKYLATLMIFCCVSFSATALELNKPVPDFTLKSSQGDNLRLVEQRGTILLINFWASWCGPCRQEMPELETLSQDFADLGVKVIGINVEQDPAPGKKFLRQVAVTFPVLFDTTNTVTEQYQVDAMPTTLLVDRDGNLRYLHRGYQPGYEEKYRAELKRLIRE